MVDGIIRCVVGVPTSVKRKSFSCIESLSAALDQKHRAGRLEPRGVDWSVLKCALLRFGAAGGLGELPNQKLNTGSTIHCFRTLLEEEKEG